MLELPSGGALLRTDGGLPVKVKLARFAGFPTVPAGTLRGGKFMALRIPADPAPEPWKAMLAADSPATVCSLPGEGSLQLSS